MPAAGICSCKKLMFKPDMKFYLNFNVFLKFIYLSELAKQKIDQKKWNYIKHLKIARFNKSYII